MSQTPKGIIGMDLSGLTGNVFASIRECRQDPDCECVCCQDLVVGCVCAADERCACRYCVMIGGDGNDAV